MFQIHWRSIFRSYVALCLFFLGICCRDSVFTHVFSITSRNHCVFVFVSQIDTQILTSTETVHIHSNAPCGRETIFLPIKTSSKLLEREYKNNETSAFPLRCLRTKDQVRHDIYGILISRWKYYH